MDHNAFRLQRSDFYGYCKVRVGKRKTGSHENIPKIKTTIGVNNKKTKQHGTSGLHKVGPDALSWPTIGLRWI